MAKIIYLTPKCCKCGIRTKVTDKIKKNKGFKESEKVLCYYCATYISRKAVNEGRV